MGTGMTLRIVTADQRLAEASGKTTLAIFGPPGVGKTTLIKTLTPVPTQTLCVDLEAGMKSVQDWQAYSQLARCRRHGLPDRRR